MTSDLILKLEALLRSSEEFTDVEGITDTEIAVTDVETGEQFFLVIEPA